MDFRSIQFTLARNGFYDKTRIDGIFGPASIEAGKAALAALKIDTKGWKADRLMLAIEQWAMLRSGITVDVDGLLGPDTRHAREQWQDQSRNVRAPGLLVAHMPETFPRQSGVREFYGEAGDNLGKFTLPYPMRLAWDLDTEVTTMQLNKKCGESAKRALGAALEHYGHEKIKELGLDLFGGSYANRPMRGGRQLSMHAYGCAIDIDPESNQLRWGRDRARMAGEEYAPFLDAFEAEGWISLGRERNFDWMHIQAARL